MIQLSKIQAIAIDLDGTTLRSDGTLGERTIQTFAACMERGIQIIICTGRSPVAAESYRAQLGIEGPMVFYNGAAVIDVPQRDLKAGTFLKADIVLGCVEIARKRDIHFHVFLPGDTLVYERQRSESDYYEGRTGLSGLSVDMVALFGDSQKTPQGAIKGMFIADPAVLSDVEAELDARFNGRIYRARSHANYLEVMAAGISKGYGLSVALELRGLNPMNTIACGDAENDLPLADVAGLFICPENAVPQVKARAVQVVPGNDEEGIAQFFWQLLQE
ncbi:MAG: Cof-type HAD-IIB family hydrolase [Termitinemataceae bacterium]